MGKLIDEDILVKRIYEYQSNAIATEDVIHSIKTMPTAYDVEKVVEQLETHKDLDVCENNCYECKKKYPNDDCPTEKCAFDKAIDIVRKGGVE